MDKTSQFLTLQNTKSENMRKERLQKKSLIRLGRSRGKTHTSGCGRRCTPCLFRAHATEWTLPCSWCPFQLKGVGRFSHLKGFLFLKALNI